MSALKNIVFWIVCILCVVVLYNIASYETPEKEFTVISEEFEVRNIYRGYENGRPILSIEYYDGKQIKILDDKARTIQIEVIVSDRDYSYLELYRIEKDTSYPLLEYRLYLSSGTSAKGISNHRDRKGQDYESNIQLQ